MGKPTDWVSFERTRLPLWLTPPAVRGGKDLFVLAPGAGAGAEHPWLEAQAAALAAEGLTVARFDFLYRARGRKAPDRLPKLVAAYRAVVSRLREAHGAPTTRLWLGGKSMGGRVASHATAEGEACAGLVFFGYPLAPRGRSAPERTAHWGEIAQPALFLTGSRDQLCPLDALANARRTWGGATAEFVLADGDHSFKVPKRTGLSSEEVHRRLAAQVARWIHAES